MIIEEPKFEKKEIVYHVISGEKGIISDINYNYSTKSFSYSIDFSFSDNCICKEHEISRDRIFE